MLRRRQVFLRTVESAAVGAAVASSAGAIGLSLLLALVISCGKPLLTGEASGAGRRVATSLSSAESPQHSHPLLSLPSPSLASPTQSTDRVGKESEPRRREEVESLPSR